MDAILQNFFNLDIASKAGVFLLQGLLMTIELSVIVIPLGVVAGLVVAVLGTLKKRWLNWLLVAYVDFFRAFPPLVLLIFIYFGTPFLGLEIPKLLAVAIGFLLNTSSYYGEVFRAGIESIPKGQFEAARSTGLSGAQTLRYVVLPQAIRNVLPDLISNTLEVIKLTTLASVVSLPELLNNARQAQALTYNPTPIVLAALMYLALLWPLVRLLSRLEHKHITMH